MPAAYETDPQLALEEKQQQTAAVCCCSLLEVLAGFCGVCWLITLCESDRRDAP
jgi:hypothetical protein